MNIVLEGPDGSGKSTLASFLSGRLRYKIHRSEGPVQSTFDLRARLANYLLSRYTIFDRFAAISEPIYGPVMQRRMMTPADHQLIAEFYLTKPLIIYCRADSLSRHVPNNATDTKAYLELLHLNNHRILERYERWAREFRPIEYTIGDGYEPTVKQILARFSEHLDAVSV